MASCSIKVMKELNSLKEESRKTLKEAWEFIEKAREYLEKWQNETEKMEQDVEKLWNDIKEIKREREARMSKPTNNEIVNSEKYKI